MTTSARAIVCRKIRSCISLKIGGYRRCTSTRMSGTERETVSGASQSWRGVFSKKRRKNLYNCNTRTDEFASVKVVSEMMDISLSWIDIMQDHWRAAIKLFYEFLSQLDTYRTNTTLQYHDHLYFIHIIYFHTYRCWIYALCFLLLISLFSLLSKNVFEKIIMNYWMSALC